MIKLVRATADGRERIVRVLRPGDVAGLEALANARYDTEAIALVDTQVCRHPLVGVAPFVVQFTEAAQAAHAKVADDKILLTPWTETDFRTGDAAWWA